MSTAPAACGLDALVAALDAARAPVTFFVRDDDAGWDDAGLFALLDTCAGAGVPIDLAVIPGCTGPALGAELRARAAGAGGALGLHQHGWRHVSHEPAAQRRSEFGAARAPHRQLADLAAGRRRLLELLGDALDPIFTPPWNRCDDATPTLLAALGLRALSRDRGAAARASQRALAELPVDVDWSREQRRAAEDPAGGDVVARVAAALAARVGDGAPTVGLMLHHATMDAAARRHLAGLFDAVDAHPSLRWRPMRALLDDPHDLGAVDALDGVGRGGQARPDAARPAP